MTGFFAAAFGALAGAATGGIIFERVLAFILLGVAGLIVGSFVGTVVEMLAAARNSSAGTYPARSPALSRRDDPLPSSVPQATVFKVAGVKHFTQGVINCRVIAASETNARAKAELIGMVVAKIEATGSTELTVKSSYRVPDPAVAASR